MNVKTKLFRRLTGVVALLVFSQGAYAQNVTVTVQDAKQNLVENIVVYLLPKQGSEHLPVNTTPVVIDQKDKKFAPYITVVQKGQSLNFVNKDDITHHIYSVSGENRFEFKIKENETKTSPMMSHTEEVAMGCNIHDWMSGYALVVDTPLFGKTDDQGQLALSVPEGEYQVIAWHPQLDVETNRFGKTVVINGDVSTISLNLPKTLLPIPEQIGQDSFDFLEEY